MASTKGRLALLRADARERVRRSAAQRAEILAAFDQSGVSAAEFARLVGVKYPTLAGWLHRRGRPRGEVGPGRSPAVRFVEAAVPPPEAPAPVELELPAGVRLRFTSPAQVPLVVALLRGLGPC
jgi:transposase-like protein